MPQSYVPQLVYFPNPDQLIGTEIPTPFWASSPGAYDQLVRSAKEGRFGSIPLSNLFLRTKDNFGQWAFVQLMGYSSNASLKLIDGFPVFRTAFNLGEYEYDP